MYLYIDTSKNEYFKIALADDVKILAESKVEAKFRQSEKLLLAIDNLLKTNNVSIQEIKKIRVNDEGEGFSSLRIGVVTANALAYALGIKVVNIKEENIETKNFSMVKPSYNQEPNIG